MAMLLFCPRCANLLPISKEASSQFKCATCPYTFTVTDRLENKTEGRTVELVGVQHEKNTGQLDMTTTCPECRNLGVYFYELQTRSADEAATIFYTCAKCTYRWRVQ